MSIKLHLVFQDRVGIVADLSRRIEAWKSEYPIPKEAFGAISAEKMEQLRALGYIQ